MLQIYNFWRSLASFSLLPHEDIPSLSYSSSFQPQDLKKGIHCSGTTRIPAIQEVS
jgi:hypothetical protein